jgi:hypothetical protein
MDVPHSVAWARATEFGPGDKVKLSYHVDGFAEFCADRSDRIAATRDLISGEVKGLGLFSAPLARPSVAGPAIAITVYGIDQFVIPKEKEQSRLIILEPEDFYYRKCTSETANVWMLAVYPFPQNAIPPIRNKGNHSTITVAMEPLNPPIASVLDLAVIFVPEEKIFLGLCVYRLNAQVESESGWLFHGPGNYTLDGRGHMLMGIYPQTEIPLARRRVL